MARGTLPLDALSISTWAFKELTQTQADDTNDHEFDNSSVEKQILLINNKHASNAITVDIITPGLIQGLAIADPSQSVAAGELWACPPMSSRFNNTSPDAGKVFVDLTGTITDIFLAVIQLP